eukprot:3168187-Prymnesium_polylepis.1
MASRTRRHRIASGAGASAGSARAAATSDTAVPKGSRAIETSPEVSVSSGPTRLRALSGASASISAGRSSAAAAPSLSMASTIAAPTTCTGSILPTAPPPMPRALTPLTSGSSGSTSSFVQDHMSDGRATIGRTTALFVVSASSTARLPLGGPQDSASKTHGAECNRAVVGSIRGSLLGSQVAAEPRWCALLQRSTARHLWPSGLKSGNEDERSFVFVGCAPHRLEQGDSALPHHRVVRRAVGH